MQVMSNSIEQFSHLFLSSEKETEKEGTTGGKIAIKEKEIDFLTYYGLKENPFSDSVNTNYFFQAKEAYNTYQKMKMCVEQNISIGLVTGQSGVGKTLITQMLLTNFDPKKYQTIVALVSPGMTKSALLKEILLELELGHQVTKATHTYDLIRLLQNYVVSLYQEGKRLVIIIDEAHFLEASSLHILRTISNIELPEMKLVTTLLFSEDILVRRLRHESYNSLRNRMYVREHLNPFTYQEMKEYIKYRLSTAGTTEDIFEEETFTVMHTATAGIAREVNNLAYNALVQAYLNKEKSVTNNILVSCL